MKNPYGDPACLEEYIMPIQPPAEEILFGRSRLNLVIDCIY
jgi:hypothetical protein